MNRLKFQISHYKSHITTYIKAYIFGLSLSTGFILIQNDIFYNNVILQKGNLYEELKPKELVGRGAKYTFIKHQMEDVPSDKIYRDYIETRKKMLEDEALEKEEMIKNQKEITKVKNDDSLYKVFKA